MLSFQERLLALNVDAAISFEEANERLDQAGLADGLPMVPPTPERIAAMLEGRRVRPEMRLSMPLMPSSVKPSLWEIAASCVMAGCRYDYLPVVVAAVLAVADPAYALLGMQATTGSATPVVLVSGPIAREIGVNGADNCMGQGHRANATIGRAVRLVLQNVGGAAPGTGDMATVGQPGKYGWCFAENEAATPFPPLHCAYAGLPTDMSAVTVMSATGSAEVVLSGSDPEADARLLGRQLSGRRGQSMVVLPPESAALSARLGWDRKRWQQAIAACQTAEGGRPMQPESVLLVVAGGVGIKAAVIPGSGPSRAVTRPVKPL